MKIFKHLKIPEYQYMRMEAIFFTDILDSAIKDKDGVFHFAALWLLQCHEYPKECFDVNILGTFNVMDACVKNNIYQRLVYSSSASVYGDAERGANG